MSESMTESEFLDRVAGVWREVESRVDHWSEAAGIDLEAVRLGPVLEIEFESGRKVVINAQTPMRQIWLASPRGAFHYQWRESAWHDTRTSTDFFEELKRQVELESGETLS